MSFLSTPWVIRPEDLVVLKFDFQNIVLDTGRKLVRSTPAPAPASISVTFQPQHIVEKKYGPETQVPDLITPSRISGLTRLVFIAPDTFDPVNYTLRGVLGVCAKWKLKVAADFVGSGNPTSPAIDETSIEIPYRLLMSPVINERTTWVHVLEPYTSSYSGRTECWYTALAGEGLVRALYTRDRNFASTNFLAGEVLTETAAGAPFTDASGNSQEPLTADERSRIVHNSANFSSDYQSRGYKHLPIKADLFHLSALGGTLNVHGEWPPIQNNPNDVVAWKHMAVLGRDEEVLTASPGYLLPFGHRAVLIKITRRVVLSYAAALQGGFFRIVVVQPKVLFPYEDADPDADIPFRRQNPFRAVEYLHLSSAEFSTESSTTFIRLPESLPVVATDRRGNKLHTQVPIIFTSGSGTDFNFERKISDLNVVLQFHQRVAFANAKDASTTHFAHDIAFNVATVPKPTVPVRTDPEPTRPIIRSLPLTKQRISNISRMPITFPVSFPVPFPIPILFPIPNQLPFPFPIQLPFPFPIQLPILFPILFPTIPEPLKSERFSPIMTHATISLDAIKALTTDGKSPTPTSFSFFSKYLQNGFKTGNEAEIFLQLKDYTAPVIDFSMGADRSGGFVQPNQVIRGLSRILGTVGGREEYNDLDEIASGYIDPMKIFNIFDKSCKIFGVFSLAELVPKVGPPTAELPRRGLEQSPSFITQSMNKIERLVHDAEEIGIWINRAEEQRVQIPDAAINKAKNAIKNILGNVVIKRVTGDIYVCIDDVNMRVQDVQQELENFTDSGNIIADAISSIENAGGTAIMLERSIRELSKNIGNINDAIGALVQLANGIELVKDLHVRMMWRPNIKLSPATPELIRSTFYTENEYGLLLSVDARVKPRGNIPAGIEVLCRLDDFDITLVRYKSNLDDRLITENIPVTLKFKHLQFRMEPKKKPDVSVVLHDVVFGGALKFIQTLRDIIPLQGFSDPPNIRVTDKGIESGFGVGIPSLSIGIFSLQNISLSAKLNVPFLGDTPLNFGFSFCSTEHPFLLTVAMLGGGGYFQLTLSPDKIKEIHVGLEFGADLSIDLGVASGSVSIMAGIYYRKTDEYVTLGGFFRIRGEVEVIGLISASIELRMQLNWNTVNSKVEGEATIIVEVSIMFFSESVEVHARRQFAGASNDPTLEDVMAPEDLPDGTVYRPWTDYCLAYA